MNTRYQCDRLFDPDADRTTPVEVHILLAFKRIIGIYLDEGHRERSYEVVLTSINCVALLRQLTGASWVKLEKWLLDRNAPAPMISALTQMQHDVPDDDDHIHLQH